MAISCPLLRPTFPGSGPKDVARATKSVSFICIYLTCEKTQFSEESQVLNETKILLVEDDSVEAGMIKRIFAESEEQAEIIQANTMQRAIELMAESRFDVVITDLNLPDCEGLETVSALLGANP
ncbi:MAG: response regulator, partial [Planctomycetota bacterium]